MYKIDQSTSTVLFDKNLTHSNVAILEKSKEQLINELKLINKDSLAFDFSKCVSLDTSGFAYILTLLRLIDDDKDLSRKRVKLKSAQRIQVYATLYDLNEFFEKFFTSN
ncbi:hypothetical protein [Psittacicella gerlachiana]|uniref:STAS domain-containing protein n=1 Tax=Psittacicella gerlachiana TaxID=2028574 RepID=A0A3A1Y9M8_9GAMM|nr:hypothetical protein [Psittacicella gerlachiana]RIY33920.1 hypothetical protein CKF59_06040 [Psittacicella gerlachiana]